ncbi:hypothetical protein FXV83_16085 [Bradyrhizobium hipponense]|uniref:Uncharacterized protein n=1 Tax=Bradyrhizobium hipponense TaxID=2605638 RepID=A0A5S4YN77_9BRAD|nr:hypothetical protein [Bradyrhizobium hipponense]TYO65453.1 hypothetical protein FXV83_16085 [Bradyrhizobium hipponense]
MIGHLKLLNVRPVSRNSGAERLGEEWRPEEDAILKDNRVLSAKELTRLLPGRTQRAISARSLRLGIIKLWLDSELDVIRNHPNKTARQLMELIPGRTVKSIQWQRRKMGLTYVPLTHKPTGPKSDRKLTRTGNPVVDSIITRCEEDGISLTGIDRELGTGHYFQSKPKTAVLSHIAKAVAFFGGRALLIDEVANITIDWNDV